MSDLTVSLLLAAPWVLTIMFYRGCLTGLSGLQATWMTAIEKPDIYLTRM